MIPPVPPSRPRPSVGLLFNPTTPEVMEQAAEPVLKLTVPLTVDAKAGLNWDEAH